MNNPAVFILGGTGSIGEFSLKALNTVKGTLYGFSCYSNFKLASEIINKYNPKIVYCPISNIAEKLKLAFSAIRVITSKADLVSFLLNDSTEFTVINGIAGPEGLWYTYQVLQSKRKILLANKESIIIGGQLLLKEQKYTQQIIPIDSEHFSLFILSNLVPKNWIKTIGITASGGPFLYYSREEMNNITPEQALKHPVWNMGNNITLGSATLANKGLEVLEAKELFNIPIEQVEVRIHPQAETHAMLFLKNSSWVSHQYYPTMEIPIAHALVYPNIPNYDQTNPTLVNSQEYSLPDFEKFPMLQLAYDVGKNSHFQQIIYTIANDIANTAFLKRQISFVQISEFVKFNLDKIEIQTILAIEQLIESQLSLSSTITQNMEKFI